MIDMEKIHVKRYIHIHQLHFLAQIHVYYQLHDLQMHGGVLFSLPVEGPHLEGGAAVCTVRKDAGDDPDVTNGVRISPPAARRTAAEITIPSERVLS